MSEPEVYDIWMERDRPMSEQINPGDGWRLLGPDEVTQQGDETWIRHKRTWEPLTMFFGEKARRFSAIRRRIPAKPEAMEIDDQTIKCNEFNSAVSEDEALGAWWLASNAQQARQLADWLTRYADWREAQEATK
jgi:hypothetical protein